jgi:hypothetical protein
VLLLSLRRRYTTVYAPANGMLLSTRISVRNLSTQVIGGDDPFVGGLLSGHVRFRLM